MHQPVAHILLTQARLVLAGIIQDETNKLFPAYILCILAYNTNSTRVNFMEKCFYIAIIQIGQAYIKKTNTFGIFPKTGILR